MFSLDADSSPDSHADQMLCLHCDLPDLLERARPTDSDLVDLIEQAFLEGQIDGQESELAYLWIVVGNGH